VHIDVGHVAYHRDHLCTSRAHRDQEGIHLGRQRLDEGRRPGATDRDPWPGGGRERYDGRLACVERRTETRLRHGTSDEVTVLPQRHVHRPVVARRLAVLAGAVERIDYPDPRRAEPDLVVLALFAQHRVPGAVLSEQVHQQVVGDRVPGVLERSSCQT